MNTNRELLDREIGAPPPFPVSVDALIVRHRRRARLRQAGLGGFVAAVVAAVLSVLVLLPPTLGPQPDHETQASSSPSAPPIPDLRLTEAARLTGALQQLVSQAFPGATLAKVPGAQAEPLTFVDRGTHFAASAVVTDASGTGSLKVSTGREPTQFRTDRACVTDPPPLDVVWDCKVNPGPDGASVQQITADIGTERFRRILVEIIKADGSAVSVEVSNGVPDHNEPYRGRRPQPLLTMEQVVAWVQEPSLSTTIS